MVSKSLILFLFLAAIPQAITGGESISQMKE